MKNSLLLSCLLALLPAFANASHSQSEIDCLTKNIYYEAGAEPIAGQIAVAQVTINRTGDKRFPNTICGVVHQKTRSTC